MDNVSNGQRILRMPEVCKVTGLGKSTIYGKLSEGTFPSPVRLGARAVGWRLADITEWLSAPERRWDPNQVK